MTRGSQAHTSRKLFVNLRNTTAILTGLFLLTPITAAADDYYWQDATLDGDWSTTEPRWKLDDLGVNVGFVTGNAAIFGVSANPTGGTPLTVTITEGGTTDTIAVTNITFNSGGVLINSQDDRTLTVDGIITVTDSDGGDMIEEVVTIDAALIGSGAIQKLGDGALVLNGDNTISGDIDVDAGRLAFGAGGTSTGLGAIDVASGATLEGEATSSITTDGGIAIQTGGTFNSDGTVKKSRCH
mgnify:CR=1 FL=1